MNKRANKSEEAIAADEAEVRSLSTGEVLREKGLCPLMLIRTYGAGVHIGYLARFNGQEAELLEARRLWRWQGANTLNEAAVHGVSQDYTRISEPAPQVVLSSVIEVLTVSEKAAPSLTKSRWPK